MAAGAQAEPWNGVSRRRTLRFQLRAPIDVLVQRAGRFDTLPGRALNLCERGIAAILAGEVSADEPLEIELQLPTLPDPLRTKARLRYQEDLRCGFEFLDMTAEQRSAIQKWAKDSKAQPESSLKKNNHDAKAKKARGENPSPGSPKKKNSKLVWTTILVLLVILGGVFWWKWNRGWEELESGLGRADITSTDKPQAQVPADVMQKLIIHRVEPVYPPEARKQGIQGVIAIEVVIGRDGSVLSMRPLNGPDVLARAAMEGLRWWKFEPYRISGEPAVVETTLAVEFKR
jgi:TonB family protein